MGWVFLLGIPVGAQPRTEPGDGLSTGYPPIVVGVQPLNGRQGGCRVPIPEVPAGCPGPPDPVDEFAVIARLQARFEAVGPAPHPGGEVPPVGDTWIGDDAAVVGLGPGAGSSWPPTWWSEGVHVDLDLSGPEDIGYKALMVAVSDLAAMGVRPGHALVSVAAPPGTDSSGLGAGLAEAAE